MGFRQKGPGVQFEPVWEKKEGTESGIDVVTEES